MGSGQRLSANVRRFWVRGGLRRGAEVPRAAPLPDCADLHEPDPFLYWRARPGNAEVILMNETSASPTDRLERSMLYVPASRPNMIEKAAGSDADAVCIDLEDAVAGDEKAASRANVIRAFRELDFGGKLKAFRINGLDTPFAYRDLIEVVEAAGDRIDVVMMPKANLPQDVRFVCMLLTQIELAKGFERQIGLEVQIESAKGFVWLREIAEASPRVQALIFGPGDYSASMQMPVANIGDCLLY